MRKRLLIIEDDPSLVELLTEVLQDRYEVAWGSDGEGLVKAITNPPHVIILDIMMHPVDGARVLLHLRADPGTAKVPVIIISAKPGAEMLARQYPHTTHLRKPFSLEELDAAIHTAVTKEAKHGN